MTDVENDNIVQDFNVNDCDTCIDNTLEIFSDYQIPESKTKNRKMTQFFSKMTLH